MPRRDVASIVFVIDEDAGPHVRDGICDAGGQAILLIDQIGRSVPDVDWIPRVREWGQALVTRDVSMRSVRAERDALAKSGVHVFILRCSGMKIDELRATIARHFPKMLRCVRNQATPFLAHITAAGVEVRQTGGRPGGRRKDE
ncbi:MAG TPA: hypothetical protein VK932_15415 [Kofleriaceae bacterium]|nr:hypothetical protein [Kofleriaceae bacterium]